MDCPSCSRDDFSSERGMKSHHKRVHGESIAGNLYTCPVCGEDFRRKECQVDEMKSDPTCSYECRAEREKLGKQVTCEVCGDNFYKQPYFIENRTHHYCSRECVYKSSSGSGNPNWNGGSDGFFNSDAGKSWRRAVFERDNYKCQDCGDDSGGNLNAHHIKGRKDCAKFEKYCIWNGVTLCKSCHAERHKGDIVYEMMLQNAEDLSQ